MNEKDTIIKTPEMPTLDKSHLSFDEKAKNARHIEDEILPRHMKLEKGRLIHIKALDDSTTVSTGDGKFIFWIPPAYNKLNLTGAYAYVTTNSSSGAVTVQIRNITQSVDMLSTAITIDANETSSHTAATSMVINWTNNKISTDDKVAIDVDGAGTGAKGLGVVLIFG